MIGGNELKDALEIEHRFEAAVKALKLVEPAIESLIGEVMNRKATNWGKVNDCLCEVAKVLELSKLPLPSGSLGGQD